jgi:hypothetical protein
VRLSRFIPVSQIKSVRHSVRQMAPPGDERGRDNTRHSKEVRRCVQACLSTSHHPNTCPFHFLSVSVTFSQFPRTSPLDSYN